MYFCLLENCVNTRGSVYMYLSVCNESVPDVLILVVDVWIERSHDDPGEEDKHDNLPDDLTQHGADFVVEISRLLRTFHFSDVDFIVARQYSFKSIK